MSQKDLDRITDVVLAHNPAKKQKQPLKVIAGAPDRPLIIGENKIPCYVLEDETRVLSQSGMFSGLGLARRGLVKTGTGAQLPRFAASKAITPFISNGLRHGLTSPILFKIGGAEAYGFPATILVEICEAVLTARNAGALNPQQKALAEQCELLVRGFAKVGIIALVDEATGYQELRERNALAAILEKYIAEELQPWTKTFPIEFYRQIFRLKGWPDVNAIKRPSVIGRYTNDLIYDRLAPGLLEELQKRNPRDQETGRREHKHHQWFTTDFGHPKLKEHIAGVMAIMRLSNPNSWESFKRRMDIAYPKTGAQIPINLDDED